MYNMFDSGFLPNGGSISDQCVGVQQIINIVKATLAECDNIKTEEEKKKAARKERSLQTQR